MVVADVAVLVVSCDKYADIWSPFFAIFQQRWPDCPWPVYLGSNHRRCQREGVTSLAIGDDRSWAESVGRMLDRIPAQHVLLFLEDFLLEQKVHTPSVVELVEFGIEQQMGCLRLVPVPPPSRRLHGRDDIGWIGAKDAYRVSTQVALWRVDTLRRLLRPGFSAWDFELQGSPLSATLPEPFCGVWQPALDYTKSVLRGQWRAVGLDICRGAQVPIDLTARPEVLAEPPGPGRLRRFRRKFSRDLPRLIRKYGQPAMHLPPVTRSIQRPPARLAG